MSQFKHHVVLHPQIKTRLVARLLEDIRGEREGKVIEKT
jgi:hypothetical protein